MKKNNTKKIKIMLIVIITILLLFIIINIINKNSCCSCCEKDAKTCIDACCECPNIFKKMSKERK